MHYNYLPRRDKKFANSVTTCYVDVDGNNVRGYTVDGQRRKNFPKELEKSEILAENTKTKDVPTSSLHLLPIPTLLLSNQANGNIFIGPYFAWSRCFVMAPSNKIDAMSPMTTFLCQEIPTASHANRSFA